MVVAEERDKSCEACQFPKPYLLNLGEKDLRRIPTANLIFAMTAIVPVYTSWLLAASTPSTSPCPPRRTASDLTLSPRGRLVATYGILQSFVAEMVEECEGSREMPRFG